MGLSGRHGHHRKGRRHPRFKHGESRKSLEHAAWLEMRKRCLSKSSHAFNDYGGRGIRICDRWQSFNAFLEDMGRKPSCHHSLDRIDNNGNYEPENCRWATQLEQARNKRNSIRLPFEGESLPIGEVAERIGITRTALWKRIFLRGWPVERAISV